MGGILKNPLSKEDVNQKDENETVSEFRKQVYKNTQLNAKLTAGKGINSINKPFAGDDIKDYPSDADEKDLSTNAAGNVIRRTPPRGPPKDVLQMKKEEEERLQWNGKNLADNEVAKQQYADIHIDEPKTPYQGAVDPEGEYYRDDDEDEDNDNNGAIPKVPDLDDFTLGEPEYDIQDTVNNDEGVEVHMSCEDDEQQEDDELDEARAKELRHKKFEEMRKKHYDLREMFKNRNVHENDENEDEVEDDTSESEQ
ncbi:hypothetical protein C6P45_003608 [Maudiozyma exigua]|uniref:Protein GLC8 n=1 Tax=Maudiozyma exigua TaxID=34358 RepID=A0A9P6WBT7_MAUEX|nr:hypothetical protein C6P45_003608 [Kazachstania exigua]